MPGRIPNEACDVCVLWPKTRWLDRGHVMWPLGKLWKAWTVVKRKMDAERSEEAQM